MREIEEIVTCIFVFFGIIWSAGILFLDQKILEDLARQVRALTYATAPGTVLSSGITQYNGSDRETNYNVSVSYSYTVGELSYTSTHYGYARELWSNPAWPRGVVAAHSPGTKIQVYYNPRDPQDAVLAVGPQASYLLMFAFLTPFNASMLGVWWVGWVRLNRAWRKPPAGGVRIITKLRNTHVCLLTWPPAVIGLAAASVLAVVSVLIVSLLGGDSSMKAALATWAAIIGGGVVPGLCQAWKIRTGKYDLIIDEMNGVLDLPPTQGRKERRRIPLSQVRKVSVQEIPVGEGITKYVPTVRLEGGERERLVHWWWDDEKAAQFVDWLQGKLAQGAGTRSSREKSK